MTQHVIHALTDKRAELAGEIRKAERQIGVLRASLSHIDATLVLFDPTARPSTIPARMKRTAPSGFKHGHFRRLILDTLRRSEVPLPPRGIAERIVADHPTEADLAGGMGGLTHKVRATMARNPEGLASERTGDGLTAVWRIADQAVAE